VHVDKWTEHYEQLQEYRKQNGNCLVPTHFSTNMKLGRWVHTQRHQHRLMQRGRKSSMTEERAKLLEELGFSWGMCHADSVTTGRTRHRERTPHDLVPAAEVRPGIDRLRVSWHERYSELKSFVQANGHFSVSPVTNAPLYAWCLEQLQRLQAMAEQPTPSADGVREPKVKGLGQDRVKSLADIGFTKDVKLAPVLCEAGAAALVAETAARELDGNSSHDEDDDHDHHEHHEDDDEDSHRNEGDGGFNGSGKNVRKVAAVIPGGENSGVSVEV
jgi:Helicase associated domain